MASPKLELVEQLEARLAREGVIPSLAALPLRRSGAYLEPLGAVAVGLVIANAAALFNFIVFNYILHVGS